jgi:hypothetical protein
MSMRMSIDVSETRPPAPDSQDAADVRAKFQAQAELEEIRVAVEAGTVTFHEVSRAWFGANRAGIDDPQRDKFRQMFYEALAQFSESRGGVETAYYCENIEVAAALTDIETAARSPASAGIGDKRKGVRDRASASAIHVEPLLGQPEPWPCKDLLFDCLDLHYRALEYLDSQPRKICMRRIFAIITSLLGTLDHRAQLHAPVQLDANEMLSLRTEYADTYAYYRKHAIRRAQVTYFLGMLLGVGVIAAAAVVIALSGVDWTSPILLMLVSAGVGAVVSVMMRMTRGTLSLDGEAGTTMTGLLGLFRPFTGAIFGALTYVLIKGGLLTLTSATVTGDKQTFYYAGLGFAVGFSERIAQIVPDVVPGGARANAGSGSQVRPDVITQITQQASAATPDQSSQAPTNGSRPAGATGEPVR